jgi:hypothetical protein
MGNRVVAAVAIVGGIGFTICAGVLVGLIIAHPDAMPWWRATDYATPAQSVALHLGYAGIVLLGAATIGLVLVFQERLSKVAAGAGVVGGLSAFAVPFAILLPIGSAIVVADLARLRILRWWLAIPFMGSAIAFFVLMLPATGPGHLDGTVAFALLYPIAWVVLGASLARVVPQAVAEPAA